MSVVSRSGVLAVPRLGDDMGGVAQVCGLAWRALEDTWPGRVSLAPLVPEGRQVPSAWDKLRFGADLAAAQHAGRVDWVLFMHLGLARVQRRVPRSWQAPYAVFLHGVEAWAPLSDADRGLLRAASVRLANSHFTARKVLEANPDIGPIVVCPLALDPARPWTAPSAGRSRSRQVLVVGRMAQGERYKGHEQLIDVFPAVLRMEPAAELILVGDGDDRPRLERRARAGDARDRVRFPGFVSREELADLYAQAALFALPSRGEGFGLVYLEAMANELACIGSTVDAAGEVIVDGVTGVLVDPDRAGELRDALVRLLGDASLRRRMGEAGRARLDSAFTFARFREALTGAIRDACQPRDATGSKRELVV